jgi:hypothetical protein
MEGSPSTVNTAKGFSSPHRNGLRRGCNLTHPQKVMPGRTVRSCAARPTPPLRCRSTTTTPARGHPKTSAADTSSSLSHTDGRLHHPPPLILRHQRRLLPLDHRARDTAFGGSARVRSSPRATSPRRKTRAVEHARHIKERRGPEGEPRRDSFIRGTIRKRA